MHGPFPRRHLITHIKSAGLLEVCSKGVKVTSIYHTLSGKQSSNKKKPTYWIHYRLAETRTLCFAKGSDTARGGRSGRRGCLVSVPFTHGLFFMTGVCAFIRDVDRASLCVLNAVGWI